jgi:heme-degrading monooxygenase HmoA
VYARSTRFHGGAGGADKVDSGIAFVKDEVWPTISGIEGCRGLSVLLDRQTGQCILTSSWDSEESMHASEEQIRSLRDRVRDMLGGDMEVDEWEIAVMHRAEHGECCRVSWMRGDVDALSETMRMGIVPELEQIDGFCGASVLVNRSTGMGCATTVWESRSAMEASRSAADEMRRRAASDAAGEIVEVHEYELAYAHLHVPEMA